MPTFHHWRAGKQRNGLTFQTAADARASVVNRNCDHVGVSGPTAGFASCGKVLAGKVLAKCEKPAALPKIVIIFNIRFFTCA